MLRMSEVNAVDHQAMQHMLTEGVVDWVGFGEQIARETDALLGGAGNDAINGAIGSAEASFSSALAVKCDRMRSTGSMAGF